MQIIYFKYVFIPLTTNMVSVLFVTCLSLYAEIGTSFSLQSLSNINAGSDVRMWKKNLILTLGEFTGDGLNTTYFALYIMEIHLACLRIHGII